MKNWRIRSVSIALSSAQPATIDASPIEFTRGPAIFDYAQCAAISPSNGLCCVQGKTTEWQCGPIPTGNGWHQVSGECYHRETGGSCKE